MGPALARDAAVLAGGLGFRPFEGTETGTSIMALGPEFGAMNLPWQSPYQAAHDGMWHFMTLVLVPDLVRWRWGEKKSDRGKRRFPRGG